MKNKITKKKLENYMKKTEKALKIAKEKINKKREKESKEIIRMVENYLSDSKYFEDKGDFVNAFACINYSHGWLDAGSRLGIFNVKNNHLFVIK